MSQSSYSNPNKIQKLNSQGHGLFSSQKESGGEASKESECSYHLSLTISSPLKRNGSPSRRLDFNAASSSLINVGHPPEESTKENHFNRKESDEDDRDDEIGEKSELEAEKEKDDYDTEAFEIQRDKEDEIGEVSKNIKEMSVEKNDEVIGKIETSTLLDEGYEEEMEL